MVDPMEHPRRLDTVAATAQGSEQHGFAAADSSVGLDRLQFRPSKPNRFQLEPLNEIEFGDQPEWLVDGLLPASGLAFVYGPPGSYKSTVTLDLAFAVASGRDWCDRTVLGGAVVYVAAEGGSGMRKRLQGLSEFKGQKDVPIVLCSAAPNLGSGTTDRDELISAIEGHPSALVPLRLVVIDTLSRTLGGADENGSGMQAVITNAKWLAEHFECLVLIVHHTGHDKRSHMRGHSSAHGDADAVWKVSRNPKAKLEAGVVIEKLKDGEDGHHLTVKLLQMNIANSDANVLVVDNVLKTAPKSKFPAVFKWRQAHAYRVLQQYVRDLNGVSSFDLAGLSEAFNAQACSHSDDANRDVLKHVLGKLERDQRISRIRGETTSITILQQLD